MGWDSGCMVSAYFCLSDWRSDTDDSGSCSSHAALSDGHEQECGRKKASGRAAA